MLYDRRWDVPEVVPALEPWRQLLLDAADRIEAVGWCQHHGRRGEAVCAATAIADSCQSWRWQEDTPVRLVAIAALVKFTGCRSSVATWNDAPGRTVEQVVAAMRKAAVMED